MAAGVRVLVTGMSGVGKSTVLAELARRGYRTGDTDYDRLDDAGRRLGRGTDGGPAGRAADRADAIEHLVTRTS